ncbi:MAG: fibronectin type III domain-containing protein, partial [Bacteroidota bacterium]
MRSRNYLLIAGILLCMFPAFGQFPTPGGGGGNTSVSAPTLRAPSNIQQTSFQMNWNAVGGAQYYFVYVSESATFNTHVAGFNGRGTSGTNQTVTGLSSGKTYYYRVKAGMNDALSSFSSTGNATTSSGPPSVPTASAATNVKRNSFRANWGSAARATGYEIDVSRNSSFTNLVVSSGSTSNTYYNVTGLSESTTYYYRVRGKNNSGESGSSSAITVRTTAGLTGNNSVIMNDQETYYFSDPVSGGYWELSSGGFLGTQTTSQVIVTWYEYGTHTLRYKVGSTV